MKSSKLEWNPRPLDQEVTVVSKMLNLFGLSSLETIRRLKRGLSNFTRIEPNTKHSELPHEQL